jgi:hypothetical protein
MQPEAGVVGPLLVIAFILGTAIFRSLSERSGQVPASTLTNSVANDPNVWSGRASQEVFVELAVSGLASMLAFDWSVVLRAIMDISAPAISLADRPQRAIRVISVRMRR